MSSVSSLNFCTESWGSAATGGGGLHFVKHLSGVFAALLQIFALPPVAELLALLSPPLYGPFSPRTGRTRPSFACSLREWR